MAQSQGSLQNTDLTMISLSMRKSKLMTALSAMRALLKYIQESRNNKYIHVDPMVIKHINILNNNIFSKEILNVSVDLIGNKVQSLSDEEFDDIMNQINQENQLQEEKADENKNDSQTHNKVLFFV